jgi:hypothetical protein
MHDIAKGINILSRLLDLQSDLLHIVLKVLDLCRSLLVKIFGKRCLPESNPLLQGILDM